MQKTTTAGDRTTTFTAQKDVGTPPELKAFGGAYVLLWLGMLGLVYLARRKQLQLKAKVVDLEQVLKNRP